MSLEIKIPIILVIVVVLILIYFFWYRQRENLRMQGSLDLRGDPDTAPSCGEHMGDIGYFPFNFGSSCPKGRRSMIMG